MTLYGTRIDASGETPISDIQEWGCGVVSIVARKAFQPRQREYLKQIRDLGVGIVLVYDADSCLTDFPDASKDDVATSYQALYGDIAMAHIVCNEPDQDSPSSWALTPWEFLDWGRAFRRAMPRALLVAGGLASGQPPWIIPIANGMRATYDYFNLHLYGRRPAKNWPDPNWGFGYAGDLLQQYQAILPDMPWIAGEYGAQASEVGEDLQAEYAYRTAQFHRDTGAIFSLHFCAGDYMVPTFGARRSDWTRRPLFDALIRIGALEDMATNRYDHPKGQHNVGPGVVDRAKADGTTITSCELYYPLDRKANQDPEYSLTYADKDGTGVVYHYSFDTNKISRFWQG